MREEKKLTLRLRSGADDDLIAWLDDLRLPHGKKGEAIKNILRRGLESGEDPPTSKLDAGSLLVDIRQVVEATVTTALANISLTANTLATDSEEDEYANNCLDQLGEELLFDLDDEEETSWGKT